MLQNIHQIIKCACLLEFERYKLKFIESPTQFPVLFYKTSTSRTPLTHYQITTAKAFDEGIIINYFYY